LGATVLLAAAKAGNTVAVAHQLHPRRRSKWQCE
jgi:hypothetical protein